MIKEKYYLGLDIGTSSVKAVMRSLSGKTVKAKRGYEGRLPDAWLDAVKSVTSELSLKADGEIAALAVSSQVGTYVVNGEHVISWSSDIGKDELEYIKSVITEDEFISEIGMKHPDIISYPLPRLLYIQKNYGKNAEVIMPKELLIRSLTGKTVTDVFSMRGICDPATEKYAYGLIKRLGIEISLPELRSPTSLSGHVTDEASALYGIKAGTPVYLGCNDFFSGLIGMGIYGIGDFFDLSGTSEHIGYISEDLNSEGFVSGKYFVGHCTYGGTKSSGASNDFAIKNFGIDILSLDLIKRDPPIFLPYLNGERAPIYDENARGVFFGLRTDTDKQLLAYSVLEGVVFSLYDIALSMNAPKPERIICGGGSSRDRFMNKLRATMFECDVVSVRENDTSALGACLLSMVGEGVYPDIEAALRGCVDHTDPITPDVGYHDALMERFEIYKEVYRNLKPTFRKFSKIQEEKL